MQRSAVWAALGRRCDEIPCHPISRSHILAKSSFCKGLLSRQCRQGLDTLKTGSKKAVILTRS